MSCFKLILGILLTLMGSLHSSSTDGNGIGSLLKAQGLKLFEELTADKSDGILRVVWLRGEQGTIIIDCDLSKGTLEKTALLKSNAAKEKRVLSESDKAVLKFIVDRFEFEKVPAEDPYEDGLDGDSITWNCIFSALTAIFPDGSLLSCINFQFPPVRNLTHLRHPRSRRRNSCENRPKNSS